MTSCRATVQEGAAGQGQREAHGGVAQKHSPAVTAPRGLGGPRGSPRRVQSSQEKAPNKPRTQEGHERALAACTAVSSKRTLSRPKAEEQNDENSDFSQERLLHQHAP